MTTNIVSFISEGISYDFSNENPTDGTRVTVQNFEDNFRDLDVRVESLPARHGGFDIYGFDRAPNRVGQVRVDFTLWSNTKVGMSGLIDEAAGLARRGKGYLYFQPANDAFPPRFCIARPIRIRVRHDQTKHSDLIHPMSAEFQADDPHWFSAGTGSALWDDAVWGAFLWGGGGTTYTGSGEQTDLTLNNLGNAPTLAKLTLTVPAGESAEDVTIERRVMGVLSDSVSYTGVLTAGDVLVIDARAASVLLNGSDAFNANFDFLRPQWMELQPGGNDIRIVMANSTDEIELDPEYRYAYV